jgi:hypothetical protein
MHISWHGQYTLKFQTGDTVIVVDPYAPDVGLRPFRSQAHVVALTHPQNKEMSHVAGVQGEPLLFAGPGEYTGADFSLQAIAWQAEDGSERAIQRWQIENMQLLNLASLNRDLTTEELQEIEKTDSDVLFIPVGGGSALSTKQASKLITTIEPRLVIPIHFALPGLKEKLEDSSEFAKAFGLKTSEAQSKIVVKSSRLPEGDMQITLLLPS